MEQNKKISTMINRMLPAFVVQDHEQFVKFIKSFFEYLESDLQPYDIFFNSDQYSDIDSTTDLFLENFKKTYIDDIPDTMVGDAKHTIKEIRNYYLSKGNEISYEMLFRIVYGTYVKIYYPKVDVLRCSHGKWNIPFYINVTDTTGFRDKFIIDQTTNAEGFVDLITIIDDPDDPQVEIEVLQISNIKGEFGDGNTIQVKDDAGTSQIINKIILGEGRWLGTDGFLSSDKKLQDNYYYQDYSYELTTNIPIAAYEANVRKLIHPVGLQMFGSLEDKTINSISVIPNIISRSLDYSIYDNHLVGVDLSGAEYAVGGELYDVESTLSSTMVDYTSVRQELLAGDEKDMMFGGATLSDFQHITIAEFENNETINTTLVHINGVLTTDFEIVNNKLTVGDAGNDGDVLNVFSLGNDIQTYDFLGDNSTANFEMGELYNINDLLVYADGYKQLTTDDVYINNNINLGFNVIPALDTKIRVYKYNRLHTVDKFSGNGSNYKFTLSEKPKRDNDNAIIVFVENKQVNAHINISTNEIILPSIVPVGVNNIEVHYLDTVSQLNDTFVMDGTTTEFTLSYISNKFKHLLDSSDV